ncbi:MAG: hypothetical protein RBR03_07185, partial [Desulfuromonas thiophila]|nr:hypothetical protein [Desulfuromonas thiophila]
HNLLNFCGYFAKSQTRSKVATSAISNYFKTLCRLLVFAMPSFLNSLEKSLDQIAFFVKISIVITLLLAMAVKWDNGESSVVMNGLDKIV